ncbi:holin family protein [Aliiroseovarius sediminis]|uniref:holin family protein n=1 Tax=Aliiroseovarius sediminis TaxID=2925839 RepID=UPI001F5882A7|nr:holin family protein [Aliiroseovarius sediminis]MCI2392900.1 holin family protein [Aliiroseovarius sediminis]
MGLIGNIFNILFGRGGNVIRETAEVFRENSEAASVRDADLQMAALDAFRAEFAAGRDGRFNRFMDGLNRVPRPALALSTLGLFGAAMVSPEWFAARMQGIALVPEPLWWLMGVVVSFYFGARHQIKGQEFQRTLATHLGRERDRTWARATGPKPPSVFRPARAAATVRAARPARQRAIDTSDNAALRDWREVQRGR